MRIESLLWGIEVGTWNKAYCFVYITCTMGSVGEYFGDSQQADRGIHVCRGGGGEVRGETMPKVRAPFICTLWVPNHLSFHSQLGPPLSIVSQDNGYSPLLSYSFSLCRADIGLLASGGGRAEVNPNHSTAKNYGVLHLLVTWNQRWYFARKVTRCQ